MSVDPVLLYVGAALVVYVGEKIQQIILTRALRDALKQSQLLNSARSPTVIPTRPPAPVVDKPPAPPPAPPTPPSPPAPAAGPEVPVEFASFPDWFKGGLHEIGFRESGTNQGIEKYIALGKCGSVGDPWCAIFANAMLEQAGYRGTRSPSSQSFRSDPNFVQLSGPAPGAIVVYWRISRASGQGHVGFYRGENESSIWTLGGNENDMVQIEALPKNSASFGLIGYYWPKTAPLPKSGSITMPSSSPVSVQIDPSKSSATAQGSVKQVAITATVFGGQQSAYGGPIDDSKPGVALPMRFSGARPLVQVTNRANNKSVTCQIVDVGPWNIDDPYWTTNSRPQAESGVDKFKGRKTNKAGIDLTAAAANSIAIDGKGLVDWDFIVTDPKVS